MELTKRRLLVSAGAVAAGGIAATTLATDGVRAQVQLQELTVPDKSDTVTGGLSNLKLATTFQYEFSANIQLDEALFHLRVGPSTDDLQQITGIRKSGVGASDSGTISLMGSLFDHPNLSVSDFEPPTQETKSTQFVVEIRMQLSQNGSVKEVAQARATPTVTITDETVTVTTSLDGDGGVTVVG